MRHGSSDICNHCSSRQVQTAQSRSPMEGSRDVRPRSTIYVSSQSCLRTRLSARTLHIPAVEVSYRLFLLPLWPQILLHDRVYNSSTHSANNAEGQTIPLTFVQHIFNLILLLLGPYQLSISRLLSVIYLLRVLIFKFISHLVYQKILIRKARKLQSLIITFSV